MTETAEDESTTDTATTAVPEQRPTLATEQIGSVDFDFRSCRQCGHLVLVPWTPTGPAHASARCAEHGYR